LNFPDYYAILGVSPKDDLQAIQRAYRRKALEKHPDRGGSHHAMVLVNEAWFVLRDAEQRAAYDSERSGSSSSWNSEEVRQAAYKAHDQAQHYPKSADHLDQWFDRIAKDFASAKYGQTEGSDWFMPSYPTVTGSRSATFFIVIGGFIGFVVGILGCLAIYAADLRTLGESSSKVHRFVVFKLSVSLLTAGGAWLGRLAHQRVAQAVTSHPRPQHPETLKRTIHCCCCNQKLLIPNDVHRITVTCQKCNTRFDVN
jgi:DnaJ domain